MRRTIGRTRRLPFKRWIALCLVLVILVCAMFVRLDARLRPMIESYGLQAARRCGMLAIHDGVEQVLAEQQTAYSDLIVVTRDEAGGVLSAQANIAAINLLKSCATSEVIRLLQNSSEQTISIPMGNLIGGSFFVGRGPYLPFKIHNSGSIITTLTDAFTDAGINQTCHRIYLDVSLLMTVLLPSERGQVELRTSFLVCETVLVGEVPQAYANLNLNGLPIATQTE